MSDADDREQLSRRRALKIMMGSAGIAANLPLVRPTLGKSAAGNSLGLCHIAPAATPAPATYAPKFFNAAQMEEIAALAETVIPTDAHSPGARAARVHEFIDEIVATSDHHTKDLWSQGLSIMNNRAETQCGRKFADCGPEEHVALLEKIASNEDHPQTVEERFFVALKKTTVEGYYTSAIGIHQDLEYQGNTALLEFPGCTHEEHKH